MNFSVPKKIVLIGASTGGPGQIQKILKVLPKLQDTTIIIAQHMTGIGKDGALACKNLNENGARCLTESAQSAITDGMPGKVRNIVKNVEVYC